MRRPADKALPIGIDRLGRLWDDRGQPVVLHPRREGVPPWRTLLHDDEVAMKRGVIAGGAGFVLGLTAFSLLRSLGESAYALGGLGVSAAGVLWGIVRLAMLAYPPRWRRETAVRRLALGECAACGFFIEDTPRDGYGCATCSECGATWLADRFAIPDTGGW